MKYLERVMVVQFFVFEKEDVPLGEVTGIFGPNGSGKSSLLDAVQIAMMGGNSNLLALNAQADDKKTTRSLRGYCLGQYGENPDQRVRDNATTYITLVWRDSVTGAPLSMGVCLYAAADRDGHEVLGCYILPEIQLAMSDHLEVVDGVERPRSWATFRHQAIDRAKVSGENPLYDDSERYIRAALLALRGSAGSPAPEAFKRAFRFALRMRFDKTVDQIVRDDVLESRPTNIKKFKEITESFRRLAEMVAQVEAKIADGERVGLEYKRAAEESRLATTWNALEKKSAAQVAGEKLDQSIQATEQAQETLNDLETKKSTLEGEINDAKEAERLARTQREAHAAHKDYGALQTAIQGAEKQAETKRTEIANNIQMMWGILDEASKSDFLKAKAPELQERAASLGHLKERVNEKSASMQDVLVELRPVFKTANSVFNELIQQGSQLQGKLELAETEKKDIENNMARVQAGRAPLSQEVQRLHSELNDHGIQATPVCDLVKISDPEWQPVIEAYLKRNVEALLVPTEQEKEAFRIYRGLTGPRAIYGAKIVMESRQAVGKRYEPGTVAALIEGQHPAAVAYLQRQFGDLRCATSDAEALVGQRTLTKDGMLVSNGEIERLRLVDRSLLRIGAGSASHRGSVQIDLERAKEKIQELGRSITKLTNLRNVVQPIAHEDSVTKFLSEVWKALDGALQEIDVKTNLMKGAADEDYLRLGKEESDAQKHASEKAKAREDVLQKIGGAETKLEHCKQGEKTAKQASDTANKVAQESQQHPDYDPDYASSKWDDLIDKHGDNFLAMVQFAEDQQTVCRRRMAKATANGSRELGTFLQKYREHAPQEISDDWRKAYEWLKYLLKNLNETELVPYKEDMDAAYRTSQETFRTDVAIALNNNLDWLGETMDRLNDVLRECPAFSNGERYRFRRMVRPALASLLNFVKEVATHGPTEDLFGGAGELPEEFKTLIDDKVAPGAKGVRSPLDDYREFFEFDIEILRDDPLTKVPKLIGHLSKRLGTGSGGEHRSPLYVIAGAALASAYRLDRGNKDGLRLMMIDEAFNKMDPTNIIATMRYLEELGLQVFMASPGENLGILTAFLHRYYDILRDVENNAILIEGRDVSETTRALFREDLPEFNADLLQHETELVRRGREIAEGAVTS